jgi:3-oxoacyl-[acyl-carrier-protein] synthase II
MTKGTLDFHLKGSGQLPAFFIPALLINLASGQIAIRHGFLGPDFAVVGACATGAEAIATGARAILTGESDVAVVGGSDATIHPICFAGFEKLHTLSTHFNDCPERASRPFDRGRDGFVLGEGAGALILEERKHALGRGAEVLAELAGYASASDAHHIAASHPEGLGEQRAMRWALERAGLAAEDIGYVNAHATSTPVGDLGELAAIRAVFGGNRNLAVSSTKSATGHTCGAAGALEAIFSICALRSGIVPPTLNLEDPEPDYADLNLVPLKAQERRMKAVLSNSFGFGATKVALVFA